MYRDFYSEEITKKLRKLKNKNPSLFFQVRKKIDFIVNQPEHNYKFLTNEMKGINRIHIGHFVLVFVIDRKNQIVIFEDFDHHDNIYTP